MENIFHHVFAKRKMRFLMGFTMILFIICFRVPSADAHGFYENKPVLKKKLFKRGEALYQKQCAICHGPSGAGDGQAKYLLYPKPRNFVQDNFRLVSTTSMEVTDDDLFEIISRGMPGSSMSSWAHLSEEDRWALVYYVRYLSEIEGYSKSGDITDKNIKGGLSWEWIERIVNKKVSPENIIKIPTEPAVTQAALKRGQKLFVDSCAGCHGVQGRGDGQQKMIDSLGYPTKPRDLTVGIFKGESSSEELYFRMMAGMPGSPMPSYNGVFTQEQIWELIHFVQSLAEPGAEERSRLKQSQISAKKISGDVALEPLSNQWSDIKPIYVALTPLWWRDDRIEGVEVRAHHNGEKIAIHLTWSDPQENHDIVEVQSFSDGAALQFSNEEDPPFFGMGSSDHPVHIWHWKAAWEQFGAKREDIEDAYPHTTVDYYESQKNYAYGSFFEAAESETKFHDPKFTTGWGAGNPLSDPHKEGAAEEGMAEGLGSYTTQMPKIEKVLIKGSWKNGKWHVVFARSLESSEKDTLEFKSGEAVSIAFALWEGSHEDRNGQKMVSIWNELIIEE